MITITRGNILLADVEALVNTVNCVGFMGKGIALQFKKAFPANYEFYRKACAADEMKIGRMLVFSTGSLLNPKYIINFPTKTHWKENSRLENIKAGLIALVEVVKEREIESIAIPPLGCGLGGLVWDDVRPLIIKAFEQLPAVHVSLFEPVGAPEAKTMPIGTARPHLTLARALIIKLMQQYSRLSYRMTLLEIQKMAYFMQEAGERLELNYEEGIYGPYAKNLNKVLEILEGHYIRGYGDRQSPGVELELLQDAVSESDEFLADKMDSIGHLDRVARLVDGFETPYGMELLSSVHWLAVHSERKAVDEDSAIALLYAWTDRKSKLFQKNHIRVAWRRLKAEGFLSSKDDA